MKITIDNLSVDYIMRHGGENLHALDSVHFSFNSGKFVCIVGPSGCGKTTLLNVIAGLQKASSGSIFLNGHEVVGVGNDRAMVFQSGALFPWRTVLQNISYGLEIQKLPRTLISHRAQEMCNLVGLAGFENSYPHELSGGMQQRVNLARALATNPKFLLMDEPFASLDAQTRELMQTEVLRIWQQTQQTVIFVTHQVEEAVFLSDEIIVMTSRPGRVKAVIPIDLPRPRGYDVKKSPTFHNYVDQIRDLVQQEFLSGNKQGINE